jgi:hypothetical protein
MGISLPPRFDVEEWDILYTQLLNLADALEDYVLDYGDTDSGVAAQIRWQTLQQFAHDMGEYASYLKQDELPPVTTIENMKFRLQQAVNNLKLIEVLLK